MGKDDSVRLTPRQTEVLKLVITGLKSEVIAEQLGVSKRTVDGHRLNLLRITDSRNTAELIAWAYKHDLAE